MRRALIIRHVPFEGIAGFRLPIEQAGYEINRIDVADSAFRGCDYLGPDLLVTMGGPMGAYETDEHPWIAGEIAGLRQRIEAGLPTLGVCLGSQLIAAALGARVYPSQVKEVGFDPVTLSEAGCSSPVRHMVGVPVLHWHGDTFDLPADVEHLAASRLTANQAFRRGRHLLALQFHAEMGEDPRFGQWLDGADDYLASAGTTTGELRSDHDRLGTMAVDAGRRMIGEWLSLLPK